MISLDDDNLNLSNPLLEVAKLSSDCVFCGTLRRLRNHFVAESDPRSGWVHIEYRRDGESLQLTFGDYDNIFDYDNILHKNHFIQLYSSGMLYVY